MAGGVSREAMLSPMPVSLLHSTRPRPQLFKYHLPPDRHTHRTRDVAWEGKRKVPEEQVLLHRAGQPARERELVLPREGSFLDFPWSKRLQEVSSHAPADLYTQDVSSVFVFVFADIKYIY